MGQTRWSRGKGRPAVRNDNSGSQQPRLQRLLELGARGRWPAEEVPAGQWRKVAWRRGTNKLAEEVRRPPVLAHRRRRAGGDPDTRWRPSTSGCRCWHRGVPTESLSLYQYFNLVLLVSNYSKMISVQVSG
jgi:hypothetical protein